ncbi:MAG: inorganic phosphate transporter [Bryobacteraceae bacterium]|nr:inorganic phosphate transporter [Bryobacteraceae bacterium]
MMMELSATALVALALVLGAEFVNGWTDAPNSIATVVSTRVLSPIKALTMAVCLNSIGAMSGTAVAFTIGTEIVEPNVINVRTVAAAMVGIIIWSTVAWKYGLPTSESHALVSGLAGAGLATAGPHALLSVGWIKVGIGLIFSSIVGFGAGLGLMTSIYRWFANAHPDRVRHLFGKLQIFSAGFMAFSHGSNDGQKFIGAFTLVLVLAGAIPEFHVQLWVILLCAIVMGFGTAVGGWRIIRTMGVRLTKLRPVQGFSAETGAALTIEIASRLGVPLSTTHTITTTIMGVGASRRFSAVRWKVGNEIFAAWILTFPICGIIAYTTTKLAILFLD